MSEQLEERVARLERQNRKLQIALGVVVVVLVGSALVVSFMPREVPDVIEARAFQVRDDNGALRASLGLDGVGVLDANETLRAIVSPTGIGLLDANSNLRALMSPAGIGVHDESGTMRGLMRPAEIGYYDAAGNLLWRAPE
jgi:hypothetical protein